MKTQKLFTSMLAILLMILVTSACGTSSADGSAAPAATKVIEPTATPEPLPDLSTARLFLEDLPEGFEEIDMEEIITAQAEAGNEEYMPEVFFTFVNKDEFQIIMGMNYLLVDAVNRIGYGAAFSDSEDTLQKFAEALGGTDIREVEKLDHLEMLGDKHEALTMISDVQGVPMRVDAVMFQRGDVGSILMTMSMDGAPGSVSLAELGSMLDQNIQESLGASE